MERKRGNLAVLARRTGQRPVWAERFAVWALGKGDPNPSAASESAPPTPAEGTGPYQPHLPASQGALRGSGSEP